MIRRVLAGLGISGTIILVSLTGQIITVPVFLTHWGTQTYGEWITLTNLVASLSILNLGVQSYTCNLLIAHFVRAEIAAGTRVLNAALRLYTILGSIALAIVIGLVVWPGVLTWLRVAQIPDGQARLILAIQGVLAVYAIWGGLLLSLFQVTKQMPRQLMYALIERMVLLFLPLLVVLFGGRPIQVSISVIIALAALAWIELRDVYRRTPFGIGVSTTSWALSRSLIRPSLDFFGVSLTATLLSTGMITVLATTIGPTAVALFVTTLMLTNMVRTIVNQGLNVLWPEITGAGTRLDDPERLARWHRLAIKLAGWITLLCAGGIALLGPVTLAFWTRGRIAVDLVLNLLLVAYLAIQWPAIVSGAFGLALNRQSDLLKVQLATVLATIPLGLWFTALWGVRGAAAALACGQIIGTTWMLKLASHWTSDSWRKLVSNSLVRGLPTILLVIIVLISTIYFVPGLGARLAASAGIVIGGSLLFWCVWLTDEERLLIRQRWQELGWGRIFSKVHHGATTWLR